MTSRERVIAAINHEATDRVPLDGNWRPDSWGLFEEHYGTTDVETISEKLGLDMRWTLMEPVKSWADQAVPAPVQLPQMGVGKENLVVIEEGNNWVDDYGIGRRLNDTGMYWLYSIHPIEHASLEEIKDYPFPDPTDPVRYTTVEADIARWGDKYFKGIQVWNIFKCCWELRGFETFMLDMAMNPDIVETLTDRWLEHQIERSKQLVRRGVDVLYVMGDIAMQDAMMFSPQMWRDLFKPRLKAWIEAVRADFPDTFFMFHSDGDSRAVFEDLIEIGFDILDPIQPECMDVEEVKDNFGARVCLHGTVSLQETLPFGTPEDVANEVRHRVSYCGRQGGLILAPSNTVQPDVSLENILALYETAQQIPVEA